MIPPTQRYTPFPYTTLFRSNQKAGRPAAGPFVPARRPPLGPRAGGIHPAGLRPQDPRPERSGGACGDRRSEEHTSELQSRQYIVCRLLLEKKKKSEQHDSVM